MRDNDGRKIDRVTQEEIRIRAARQVVDERVPAEAVAAALGLSRSAVFGWAAKYRAGGEAALWSHPAPGRVPKLDDAQRAQLYGLLRRDPRSLGFEQALWTRKMVAELIRRQFGVVLSLPAVGAMLHRMGLSVQRPVWRAYQQDPVAVERWKTEVYPQIRAEAAAAGATIFFADEAGVRFDEHAGTTWAPVGLTPVVSTTGQHISINMISAVTPRGALRFGVYDDNLNAARFIDFCRRLLDETPGPVVLIVDGHPAHRARATSTFVAGTRGRLSLRFLPGYAPSLNPDEWVWKAIKHDRLGPAGLVDAADLRARARGALHRLQKLPGVIRGFFGDPDLAYITV